MKKIALVAASTLVFATTAVVAEPIVVRSGDHSGFTRLVMRLPDGVQWQVTEARGLKTVSVSGHDAGFDTSRVFDVIPQDRLTGVRSYPSRLEIEVSCDCDLNTFVEQNDFLVLDVLDGPALPPLEARQAPRFISARPNSQFNFGDLLWSEFAAREKPDPTTVPEGAEPAPRQEDGAVTPSQSAVIEETRERVLFGIGDAASRGILDAATPDLIATDPSTPGPSGSEIYDSSEEEALSVLSNDGNIRVTNSRDVPTSEDTFDLTTSGALCADPQLVDIPSWSGEVPFIAQVSALRKELFSETDRLNSEAAKKLAKLYIHFGFGAEAKQVLRLSESLMSEHPELMDIADILEHGYARNPRFLHRFSDCNSDLALWSMMAAKKLPQDQVVAEEAVLRALARLPIHLKQFLSPAISSRFTELGDLESASIALRNIELRDDVRQSDADLAKSKIEKEIGNSETAEDLLTDVIEENSADSPQALIAFVDSRISGGQRVPADIALLVEAYSFELRSDTISKDLARAHVLASAYSGQFEKAFAAMNDDMISSDGDVFSDLQSYSFVALSNYAEDISFLDVFFRHFPTSAVRMTADSVNQTASRLIDLGFAAEADGILSTVLPENRTESIRLTHAKALLQVNNPEAALAELEEIEGPLADRLRARALLAMGDNEAAFEIFRISDTPQEAIRSAWLAEQWQDILPPQTSGFEEIRTLARETVDEIEPENGMLERSTSALVSSSEARLTLETLLNEFSVSP